MDTLYDKKQSYPFDYFFEESTRNKMNPTPNNDHGGLEDDTDSSSIGSEEEEGSDSEEEENNDHTH